MAPSNGSGRPRSAFALTLIGAVFLIASAHMAHAGTNVWTGHGPYAPPQVSALAIDPHTPSTLYAGSDHGVFQSTNGGASWTAVNIGLTGDPLYVAALAIDPETPSTLTPAVLAGKASLRARTAAPPGSRRVCAATSPTR